MYIFKRTYFYFILYAQWYIIIIPLYCQFRHRFCAISALWKLQVGVFRIAGSVVEGPIRRRILCSLRGMLGGDVPLKFPEAERTQEGGSQLAEEHEDEEVRGYCILLGNFCSVLSLFLAFEHVFLSLSLSLALSLCSLWSSVSILLYELSKGSRGFTCTCLDLCDWESVYASNKAKFPSPSLSLKC